MITPIHPIASSLKSQEIPLSYFNETADFNRKSYGEKHKKIISEKFTIETSISECKQFNFPLGLPQIIPTCGCGSLQWPNKIQTLSQLSAIGHKQLTDMSNLEKAVTELAANIFYIPTPDAPLGFEDKVKRALGKIASSVVGTGLLAAIASQRHRIDIFYHPTESSAVPFGKKGCDIPGVGTPSFVSLSDRKLNVFDSKFRPIKQPFYVTVAHELIHALHNAYGKNRHDSYICNPAVWSNDEEFMTIALENDLRREKGLTERYSHWGIAKGSFVIIPEHVVNASKGLHG